MSKDIDYSSNPKLNMKKWVVQSESIDCSLGKENGKLTLLYLDCIKFERK